MRLCDQLSGELREVRPALGPLRIRRAPLAPAGRPCLAEVRAAVLFDVLLRCLRDQFGGERVLHLGPPPCPELEGLNLLPADAAVTPEAAVPEMVALLDGLEAEGRLRVDEGRGVVVQEPDGGEDTLWHFDAGPAGHPSPWGRGRPAAVLGAAVGLPGAEGPVDVLGLAGPEAALRARQGLELAALARRPAPARLHLAVAEVDAPPGRGDEPGWGPQLEEHGPGALRWALLAQPRQQPLSWSEAALTEAGAAYHRLLELRAAAQAVATRPPSPVGMRAQATALGDAMHQAREDFQAALDQDLDTPAALAATRALGRSLDEGLGWVGDQNPGIDLQAALRAMAHVLDHMLRVLGFMDPVGRCLLRPATSLAARTEVLVDLLVELADRARRRDDHSTVERIRTTLEAQGFVLEPDVAGRGWRWR